MDVRTLILLDGGAPNPPDAPLVMLTTDRQIFRQSGQPWRWKGVSAFQLLDRFAHGEDIDPFLAAYAGFNLLRVWTYTPRTEWGDAAWDWPTNSGTIMFVEHCAARGFYVELTLLTDDDQANLNMAQDFVRSLPLLPSLLLEGGNEPRTHKSINTAALRDVLEHSGMLYASGDYEESARAFGPYLVAHTGRDSEWPRRAHDLLEFYGGGGPNAPSDPAHRCPCVADEPIRPDQATPIPGAPRDEFGVPVADAMAYYGTCALLGAGGTVHTESGKLGLPPDPYERNWIATALAAMDVFPDDAPLGPYRRPVENSLRTYVVGDCMVRIRPTTPEAPEPGWTPIDDMGVLWRR